MNTAASGGTPPAIQVRHLSKTYKVAEREAGLGAALRSLAHPSYRSVEAVQDVSFDLQPGEMIALLGPNGAGKTTVLKMLSGLLYPSGGEARVAGFIPWQRRPQFLRRVAMVLGNKSQLLWDIPALDTLRVLAQVYAVSPTDFKSRLDELVALLDMEDLLRRPVRNLSLGERMKCELAAGLLHAPTVVFLDEPTLGLDVSMQARLRRFFVDYNRRHGAAVILTSHYMADVTALCERVVLIHHGCIQFDGALNELAQRLAPFKMIRLTLGNGDGYGEGAGERLQQALPVGAELLEQEEDGRFALRIGREAAPQITAELLARLPVADLTVEDPPIEAVIDRVYQEGAL